MVVSAAIVPSMSKASNSNRKKDVARQDALFGAMVLTSLLGLRYFFRD